MRIIIPFDAGEDSFEDNVAHTLKAQGHEVVLAPRPGRLSTRAWVAFLRSSYEKSFPQYWNRQEQWLVRAVREFSPDMVLCLTQALREEVLLEVRRLCSAKLVAWWGDPPANLTGMGLLSAAWDGVFLKDAAAVQKFCAVGLPAHHLHEAANPTWHRQCFRAIGSEVVVAGSCYGYRQYLVEQLTKRGVEIALYGPALPRWATPTIRQLHRGRYIVGNEKSRLFGEALACLNSTSLAEGNSLNCRAFEIAAAAGLQLIEDKPAVAECFEPGQEVLTYRHLDDISAHLDRARREPDWALGVRLAAHARVLKQHTYAHRLTVLFSKMGLAF